MRIEFDPTNPTEAAAVRAMLTALSGEHAYPTHAEIERFLPSDEPEELDRVEAEVKELLPDSNGEPHDPRIHSSPPKTNADGTWRAKRGVKAEEIAAVKAEREQAPTQDDPEVEEILATEPPLAPPAPNTPVEEPKNEPETIKEPAPLSSAPTPPAPTPPVETFAGGVAPSFLDVMKAITAAQKDGKIDTAKVKELCAAVGAGESTMGLNGPDNGDKRVAFMALLGEVVS